MKCYLTLKRIASKLTLSLMLNLFDYQFLSTEKKYIHRFDNQMILGKLCHLINKSSTSRNGSSMLSQTHLG